MRQPLSYVGRQATRSDGQARRIAILEATLQVIVQEGVRGVRHRAVAKVANVPLASTTYYFNDIKDLISDALTYFAEKTQWMNQALEQQSLALLSGLDASLLGSTEGRARLIATLTSLVCAHIRQQVSQREHRILEYAFHEEALRNPQLARAIKGLDDTLLASIMQFFELIEDRNPLSCSYQVLGLIKVLEYQYVLSGGVADDDTELALVVSGMFTSLLGQR